MASQDGGMEIETVAEKTPERIHKEYVDPATGLIPFQARKLAFALGLEGDQIGKFGKMLTSLYNAFVGTDASLLEINPLIVTKTGDLLALDAKMTFDDSALGRHPELKDLRDLEEEDPLEVEASKFSLNYIRLEGTIGCMVNGAGLAMATMDIIKLAGGIAGELPGCRRRREQGTDSQRVQDPDVRPERASRPHQYLRRHPALRHPCGWRHRRRAGARRARAHRHPHGRHERRGGQAAC